MASTEKRTGFNIMAKPVGPICNLDCEYCYYLEKEHLYPGQGSAVRDWAMPDSVLESHIRQSFESQRGSVVTFVWQGGEPTLLGIDYFRKIIELQRRFANGRRFSNVLQTNGVLIDERWAAFFAEHDFLIGISIDGDRQLHDHYRVDKSGAPTFDKVVRGIELLKKHGVEFNTLTVVQSHNVKHPLAVYRFLRDIGSGHIQFIPIVEREASRPGPDGLTLITPRRKDEARVTSWSVDPREYGEFLCAVFDEWVRNDVGSVYVQAVEVAFESWLGMEPSLCVFKKTCGKALAMEHNGDLYACDHYVYPEYKLGNITDKSVVELVQSPEQEAFGLDKERTLPKYCQECEVLFACNGECPKHRFATTPDGEPGLNYLCAGYKLFFNYINPYMEFMANELRAQRPPANVMEWARSRPRQAQQERPKGTYRPATKKQKRVRRRASQ